MSLVINQLEVNPVYLTSVKLPKRKGATDIFRVGLDNSQLRKLMKTIFPGKNANWHREQAMIARHNKDRAHESYQQCVQAAFVSEFGREPQITDYQVSGIYRDDLSEVSKTTIRMWLRCYEQWKDIYYAHKAATKYNR